MKNYLSIATIAALVQARDYKKTILKVSKFGLAALMAFSVCNQSGAESTIPNSSSQTDANTDFAQLAQRPPSVNNTASPRDPCGDWNVFALDNVPVYWDRPGSPTFTYHFQVEFATQGDWKTAPIGVVLPGGPGAPSIGSGSGKIFPPTFNVIYTDVRGVGCNINPANPFRRDALTTEYYARDVLSIVKRVLGQRNYVLFGVSFGTAHATMMTNIAQREGIKAPNALILEGVLGNWWINVQEVADYNKAWTKAKALIPSGVAASFSQTPLPLGIPDSDWITFLTATLNAGTTPELGNNTAYYLRPLASTDTDELARAKAAILAKIAEIKAGIRPETAAVATVGYCTETAGSLYKRTLVNGEFVSIGPDLCPLLGLSFLHPYDSVQFPVTVPIYYFEGSDDPNTSPENAAYHFYNQTQTVRLFALIQRGGHTAMSGTLHQTGCTPAIFEAIATNPGGIWSALYQCHWEMNFSIRTAGQ